MPVDILLNGEIFDGDLGRAEFGTETTLEFTIRNTLDNSIEIIDIQSTYPDTVVTFTKGRLYIGESLAFELVWTPGPDSIGSREGTLTVDYEEYL